jgi:hypothetical protein
LPEQVGELIALLVHGESPTVRLAFGLVAPFQQMYQENLQTTIEFPLLAGAHAVEFLGQMSDIQFA